MITPIELQSKTFKTGIGYDKKDVDNFLNELLIGYEAIYKENMELNDKISVLNEGINYYKTIEKTLQKALVLAEQTAEETKNAANLQATAIKEEARVKAQMIVAEASSEYERLQQQTIQLIRQYEAYKAQFKHLASAQCELLESDSFKIHIANLDTFLEKTSEQGAINFREEAAAGIQPEIKANRIHYTGETVQQTDTSRGSNQDDLEFYNLGEDE
ncbi:hypothetical protein acsn021_25920 [Anaerocolumna cellulosilytica]|uniref:Uncharacterized protein n=1 Tax=Anaerocolumna cellulosilytica TaxID=433286 RepID=A0A6S6QUT0_9FIRM|nr:DivIVA domain-containing protein [Anaerocolumna cellulosilytica]MBB5193760.1 cell division initiation protein [Anaerocolumna cellulosilytica]BCJ95023.1 hypothetical protein acsn021_25920 [Anaerocolumna cellulosilytica]